MRGKNKCKILKQIRRKIAEENDIPLITKECTYQGECSGTCPRCEAELRYLEQQLARRQALGKTVTVAALSVGLMAGAVGCSLIPTDVVGDVPMITEESIETEPSELGGVPEVLEGEPTEVVELIGEVAADPSACDTDVIELDGDVAYFDGTTYWVPRDSLETLDLDDLVMGAAPVDPEATVSEGNPGDWGEPND